LLRWSLEAAHRPGVGTDGLQLGAALSPEPGPSEDPVGLEAGEGARPPIEPALGAAAEHPEGVPRRPGPGPADVGVAVPPARARRHAPVSPYLSLPDHGWRPGVTLGDGEEPEAAVLEQRRPHAMSRVDPDVDEKDGHQSDSREGCWWSSAAAASAHTTRASC